MLPFSVRTAPVSPDGSTVRGKLGLDRDILFRLRDHGLAIWRAFTVPWASTGGCGLRTGECQRVRLIRPRGKSLPAVCAFGGSREGRTETRGRYFARILVLWRRRSAILTRPPDSTGTSSRCHFACFAVAAASCCDATNDPISFAYWQPETEALLKKHDFLSIEGKTPYRY